MGSVELNLDQVQLDNRYRRFDLKANPFQVTAISADDPTLPLADETLASSIKEFLVSTYTNRKYGGMVVIGEYGFGKTYLLKHIQHEINESWGYRGNQRALAIYVENPRTSADQLTDSIVHSLGLQRTLLESWRLVTEEFRIRLLDQGDTFLEQFMYHKRQFPLVEKGDWKSTINEDALANPRKFLEILFEYKDQVDLSKMETFATNEVFSPIFRHEGLARYFASFEARDQVEFLHRWTERLEFRHVKSKFPTTLEKEYLRSIFEIYRRAGYRFIYILIDEFEDIKELSKNKRLKYLTDLREIIQHNTDYFALILCLKKNAWDAMSEVGNFPDRFSRQVKLESLTPDSVRGLIIGYLDRLRFENSKYHETPFPFEEDAVKAIQQIGLGVPRIVIEICHTMLEYAADDPQITKIDGNAVNSIDKIRIALVRAREGRISPLP